MKMADSTPTEHFEVFVVKISARSDKIRGRSNVSQSNALHEKPIFNKNAK